MSTATKVLGICGSLRQASYNAAALRAAQELAPAAGAMIETADISDLPLYNEDLRAKGFPRPVERLREQIRVAAALARTEEEMVKATEDWNAGRTRGATSAKSKAAPRHAWSPRILLA